ncbi:MAG: type II toxin-antitoxin system VapC family toxin [Candidatus Electrothrix aestuarii]|uniref:Type II toxin-antitoxin system VapC family toxin n=1 Tax=Candidatus Electrothrix aestuarii TaxID=3062594 RepID=A0AAU8LS27_9BACT|nr:type II toxin-antitoxin system VapC family toxin [Candidatus Electrothrix aestuarii]
MSKTVYIETSIISYLASWPSRDLIAAGHQQLTHDWWSAEREDFSVYVSALVLKEASAGDTTAASARLQWLRGIPLVDITPEAEELSELLIRQAALLEKAAADALHIAIASYHRLDFLLTWNCKHIANAVKRPLIEHVCREYGFEPPILCTPEELTGGRNHVE